MSVSSWLQDSGSGNDTRSEAELGQTYSHHHIRISTGRVLSGPSCTMPCGAESRHRPKHSGFLPHSNTACWSWHYTLSLALFVSSIVLVLCSIVYIVIVSCSSVGFMLSFSGLDPIQGTVFHMIFFFFLQAPCTTARLRLLETQRWGKCFKTSACVYVCTCVRVRACVCACAIVLDTTSNKRKI